MANAEDPVVALLNKIKKNIDSELELYNQSD